MTKRILAKNAFVEIEWNDIRWPDGETGTHVRLVEPMGGAVALVVDARRRVLLQRAYKYGIDREVWEAPRGYAEPGESPAAAAARELREETGGSATRRGRLLGRVAPNTTVSASVVPVFLFSGEFAAGDPTDARERPSDVRWFGPRALDDLIEQGELIDGFTLAALALWWSRSRYGAGQGRDDPTD